MVDLAIIGGTGLTSLKSLEVVRKEVVHTPYGEPSSAIIHGLLGGREVAFMARHGYGHTIPPHRVNYRANLWALQSIGVTSVIAVAAVGGIRKDMIPGQVAIPNQIVDYTWSREHTFCDHKGAHVTHIDFTDPYCAELRERLLSACDASGCAYADNGTYGATQGPRLETAQEINRLESDGCDMVGMTGMPEAALARELALCYASCAVIANWAAGRGESVITAKTIDENLQVGMAHVRSMLEHVIA
ncbi:MAG TPA: S-methyl-5'-thioinosine phosphorylase [Chromatiaceae bacterium]|jgi:5'-methylthioinosine phosphorylase|nr:S-methyl-5'-thioinosine phosphorylase [Chromatiaceae bacterium]HIA08311.1 S-methyl-5'-thioinosine phosphorylase [Chromatiaceae bacterium]HIB83762.1 S-methyl-5'-thioinosine phosphorylase [Chromatiaceae bacterium]HIN81862.1 S-methyl-5'-thioinosine phosphorylase [Chromatiales bacterium]HIO54306.1 S-methyl-5'-thioinosine phosphorylase [Chromatiales bacterium]